MCEKKCVWGVGGGGWRGGGWRVGVSERVGVGGGQQPFDLYNVLVVFDICFTNINIQNGQFFIFA